MIRIALVEDETFVAALLETALIRNGYQVTTFGDAETAWQALQRGTAFDAALLDRQLPGMDGLTLLQQIKASPRLRHLPVVLQTGLTDTDSIREGLAAGAYYYLTKPVEPRLMLAVIAAALDHARDIKAMQLAMEEAARTLGFLEAGAFRCRTLAEARELAQGLAQAFPDPVRAGLGLLELLVNAVEHGNLGISYAEKTALVLNGQWLDEVKRREANSIYGARSVHVALARTPEEIRLTIRDEGQGFAWQDYLELSPQRAFDPHGRGIAMTRMASFDSIEYQGNGNTVVTKTFTAPAKTEQS